MNNRAIKTKDKSFNLIKREVLSDIRDHLTKKEITLIAGARQVGKTTIMSLLKDELEQQDENVIYISVEESPDYFKDHQTFLDHLRLQIGDHGYIFIDEIQRKTNAGLFLKAVYDYSQREDVNYKFIVSGSGSLELKEKIHESLAGRKIIFEVHPVRFKEFVNYKTNYKFEDKIYDFLRVEKEQFQRLLREYLSFGGYPRVITSEKLSYKNQVINDILESYLEKDINLLLNIKKRDAFRDMLEILSGQLGGLLDVSKLSSDVGISQQTIDDYLHYAEKTFTINRVRPFFTNKRKEIVKAPVVYFNDIGLRNYLFGSFGDVNGGTDYGPAFENIVFNFINESLSFSSKTVHYWRTQTKAEVDFVVNLKKENKLLPIEVKFSNLKESNIGKSLHSFIEKYKPKKALIVNLALDKEVDIKGTTVRFITVPKLLQEFSSFLK